jgi:hypothetical protein
MAHRPGPVNMATAPAAMRRSAPALARSRPGPQRENAARSGGRGRLSAERAYLGWRLPAVAASAEHARARLASGIPCIRGRCRRERAASAPVGAARLPSLAGDAWTSLHGGAAGRDRKIADQSTETHRAPTTRTAVARSRRADDQGQAARRGGSRVVGAFGARAVTPSRRRRCAQPGL